MSTEKKYLSDGRKVVVIGSINKTEYIVQEVYVTEDGSEIPSGENFTAKNLLDEPAKSWKEKEAEKIEKQLEDWKLEKKKLDTEIRNLKQKRLAHSTLLQSNEKFLELFEGCDTEFMADLMTGNMKYVMPKEDAYSRFEVKTFEEAVYRFERQYYDDVYTFEGIRMISVMAAKGSNYPSDRKFHAKIHTYQDGSGGSREHDFFKDLESVKEELTKRMYNLLKERNKKSDKPSATTPRTTLTFKEIADLEKWIIVPEELKEASKEEDVRLAKVRYEEAIKRAEEQFNKEIGEV